MRAGRLLGLLVIAGAMASATFAVAQPRGRAPAKPTKPAPPAAKGDAAAPAAVEEPTAAPPEASELLDGGLRPSPLTPQPEELPSHAADGGTTARDVDVDRLLADIAALRARVAAVSDGLYRSRVAIAVETSGDHGKIARLTVSLDDGAVWTSPAVFSASDPTTVYDHAVAPGRHAVTVDVERKDDRDESFRTSQRSRFTVDVPRDQRLLVEVKLEDDSTMGKSFAASGHGKYDLGVRVKTSLKPAGK